MNPKRSGQMEHNSCVFTTVHTVSPAPERPGPETGVVPERERSVASGVRSGHTHPEPLPRSSGVVSRVKRGSEGK